MKARIADPNGATDKQVGTPENAPPLALLPIGVPFKDLKVRGRPVNTGCRAKDRPTSLIKCRKPL